jgi:phage gpG-like protein
MATIRVTYEPGRILERCQAVLEANKTDILRGIGMIMVSESQDAFKRQEFGGRSWAPRKDVNIFGLIADFAAGRKEPFKRRFQTRPALMDTGQLRMTLNFKVAGDDAVVVGSALPYAEDHQYGGETESEKITEPMQDAIRKWLSGKGKKYEKRLGWLTAPKFTNQTIIGRVHRRRFLGVTKRTIADVEDMIGVTLKEQI